MPSQWYCFTDDQSGPYTFQELAELIARGELRESDLVRRSESTQWQQIDSVLGLMRTARKASRYSPHANRRPSPPTRQKSFTPTRIAGAVSVLMILVLIGQGTWMWVARPARFPSPPAGGTILQVPSRLQQMRPRPPAVPILPQLKPGEPVLVPGFEDSTWLKSPTLTSDMLTIVCVRYAGNETLDDLLIAERRSLQEPFKNQRPISSTLSADREAHPALSGDGLQLIFVRLGPPTELWIARRPNRQAEFSAPVKMPIATGSHSSEFQDSPQFIDAETIHFATGDADFTIRTQLFARRASAGAPFSMTKPLPLPDPWPRYFITAAGRRAYFPAADGIRLTALDVRQAQYLPSEILLTTDAVGPDLTKYDDTLWVSPHEDLIFYCGPGPARLQQQGHRLWMVRP
jgi:hypothetical protein